MTEDDFRSYVRLVSVVPRPVVFSVIRARLASGALTAIVCEMYLRRVAWLRETLAILEGQEAAG